MIVKKTYESPEVMSFPNVGDVITSSGGGTIGDYGVGGDDTLDAF